MLSIAVIVLYICSASRQIPAVCVTWGGLPRPMSSRARNNRLLEFAPEIRQNVTLYPRKGGTVWYVLLSAGFVAIGVWMILEDDWRGWLSVVFFGLCAVWLGVDLLPGASYLQLTPEGFLAVSSFRRWPLIRWTDVSEFRVVHVYWDNMVVFNFGRPMPLRASLFKRLLSGERNILLPTDYGFKARDLVDLMNRWRTFALKAEASEAIK